MNTRTYLAIAIAAALGGTSTVSFSDDVINACAGKNGSLRVVSVGESCKSNEQALAWSIQGPPGGQGKEGPIGPVGPSGLQGEKGPQGLTGLTGAQGPVGPVGPAGPQGDQGPEGPIGKAGIWQFVGFTGQTTFPDIGIEGMYALCQVEYGESARMCEMSEFRASPNISSSNFVGEAWIGNIGRPSNNIGNCSMWSSNSASVYSNGATVSRSTTTSGELGFQFGGRNCSYMNSVACCDLM